jgi:hypothetical protein
VVVVNALFIGTDTPSDQSSPRNRPETEQRYACCSTDKGRSMAAIARILFRNVSATETEAENSLNAVVIFSAIGLLVSLVMLVTFGLDLSPGIF